MTVSSGVATPLPWLILTDGLYLLFYLLLAVAALTAPHRENGAAAPRFGLETLGLTVSMCGFLAYFVLVPSYVDVERYRSWLPSMYLFLVLDLMLVFYYARLYRDARCSRWRSLYGALIIAPVLWAGLDLVECLDYAGALELPGAGPFDLLWNSPLMALVAASRLRRADLVPDVAAAREDPPSKRRRLANVALVSTVTFPLLHLVFSSSGLVDPGMREAREYVVLGSVIVLGALAALEGSQMMRMRLGEQMRRRRAEGALRESEARYRKLVENAPEAIVVLDIESGKFVDFNVQALDLFQVSREELRRLGPMLPSPPVQPDETPSALSWMAHVERARRGDNPSFEWVHRSSSGEEIYCEVFLTALTANGKPQVRGSIIDVSDRVAMRDQLRQSQRLESIGRLAGGIAHDFNNLLTVITGYCDLALARVDLDGELRGELEQIRASGDRAATLTSQLLAFSRRQVMKLQPFDLNEVVEEMSEMLKLLVGEDVAVETDLDPAMKSIVADAGQVEQAVVNLVANGRDAMPDGGTIAIETSVVELETGFERGADTVPAGCYGRLAVRDTGKGMSSVTAKKVFEPFFTTKPRGQGTGLGLAMVYGVVTQSGGYVTVDSRPGEGATFALHFPLAAQGSARRPGREVETPQAVGCETVLIIEDEKAVRELLRVGLTSLGFRVLVAADAREAVDLVATGGSEIDLVVSDVVLPGESGPDAVERIKEILPEIRVIFVSGYADDLIAGKGELDASAPFLQKPFTASQIAELIRDTLDRPAESRASAASC